MVFYSLLRRNIKLFFKDKGMFFTSLITPAILLVLYISFLGNVYRESFLSALPQGVTIAKDITDSFVGGQLISSILAVSCVTVAFCSNMLMVNDKANGTIKDLTISPLRSSVLAFSYYSATLISTLIICFTTMAVCLIYIGSINWYFSLLDIFSLIADIFLLVMFGTALSTIINFFLSTNGQISAVGTIVSSGYGFICGAYMPISQFSKGLQRIIMFLPGTYGTALIRNHSMKGVFLKMSDAGLPKSLIEQTKDAVDCNLYFYGEKVTTAAMYGVLIVTIVLLMLTVLIIFNLKNRKRRSKTTL